MAKRGCPGSHAIALAGDRLSDLPDGLLHTIMSFLPAPQVVQTSVLSRRWRDLWRSTPCINIEEEDFSITSGAVSYLQQLKKIWGKLENFTTNFLMFHNNVALLDKFRICTDYSHESVRGHRNMDMWLRRGIKYCPRVLEIVISSSRPHIPFPHMGASSCRLQRLHLNGLLLDNQFAELLSSGCPVLEDLELRRCSKRFQELKSRTLKRLVIIFCHDLNGDLMVITVPRMVYLRLVTSPGFCSNGISIYETASLVKASIELFCFGRFFSLKHQRWLLGNLCNVPDLELSGFQTMAMLVEESVEFPIFTDLQNLSLKLCFRDKCDLNKKLDALGSFVQNAPCLEKLTLQDCMFEVASEKEGQLVRKNIILQAQDHNTFRCLKLKFIEVVYKDHNHQLVELLWGIGRRLPDASIILTNALKD